ncbi:MAG: spermidine/putrescine ABC transporter substrate-binding protein [Limnothrix sp.]|uniref:polyamine ABC transporter substrate-binding protein n=1 Tax=unclassified Limnothrix TaxID=2632864 RepID=UPI00081E3F70|nr:MULTISPECIES: spermidine/putrescine ABC transporter substrate-binding protein [unclassified Limnothrix]MEB3118987.1 spermidine/putrescine ABC transporter substrate-binding protein [Limnothrix sp.]OCQ92369.1 polyamine ABC transporter substrate-binding protein [Limnothrix sp. P13C2]RFP56441.1 MAG: spermidine/putrescine ABC transporter substrate-binding protein [Limnothrix sp. CACIAM 69d]MBD2162200.1 spermidine/putrescine ABC transporter substrate-binding protein [Limnothrix sp. FACHB-1083]MBD
MASVAPSRRALSRRDFLRRTSVAAAGLAMTGCGWRLAQVRPSPGAVGDPSKLYIYTWAGYTDELLIARFQKETGLSVVVDIFDSNEVMLAKLQAGGGSQYSIIYPSDYMVRQMRERNLLRELDHDRLLGLQDLLETYQNPSYDPKNGHSVPAAWGTTGLIYNRQRVDRPPTDWEFLWANRARLQRQVTLFNDQRETMGLALRRLGHSYNSQDPDQIRQAYEALRELRPAIAQFTTDGWKDRILAGDLTIAMGFSSDAIEAIEENDQLGYVIPASGSSLWTDTMAIPISAPNVEAAYAWMNFTLQPEVAAGMTQRLKFATASRRAIEQLPPDLVQNPSLFPSQSVLDRCEGIAPVGAATSLYDRYWTQLTSG